jgi:hypothetical protein
MYHFNLDYQQELTISDTILLLIKKSIATILKQQNQYSLLIFIW